MSIAFLDIDLIIEVAKYYYIVYTLPVTDNQNWKNFTNLYSKNINLCVESRWREL